MRPAAVDTDERPFVLVWEVTQACDLACEHCRAEATPRRHPDELTTAEGRALLEEARRFGDGQLVVLSGGDPLYRDDVADLVRHGTDLGLRMTLTPSGTDSLSPDRVADLADAGVKRLALSLDGGTPDSHDAFRGEPGSFEQTLRAARAARDVGLPIQLNTTVCDATADDLPAIRDLVAELGAVLWSVFFLVPVGRGAILDPVPPERAERIMEWLLDVAEEAPFGVKTTEAPQYRRVALQRHAAGRRAADRPADGDADQPAHGAAHGGRPDAIGRRTGIVAGDGFAFVSHTGEVYPSGFLPLSAGNVRRHRLTEIYRESDRFRRLRDRDQLSGKCGDCEFRHVCGGSRSRAYAVTGDPVASDPLCPYVPNGYDGPLPGDSSPPGDGHVAGD